MPRTDHDVLDARGGAGRLVGCGLVVRNPSRAWWGEGAERIVVDAEPDPCLVGTGTEDYFGYAWCSSDRFDHPLHAQPFRDGPGNFGRAHNVRLQLFDAVPFSNSLRFDFEVRHWDRAVTVDYATTAWWYGARGIENDPPEMPGYAERELTALSPPPPYRVAGVLEGEALEVLSHSGGSHSIQDMGEFTRGGRSRRWSGGAHLWWIDAKPGERLELAVPVPAAGKYRVEAVFTTARDYGRAKFSLAGRELGGELEFYSRDVRSTGVVTLGDVQLEEGVQSLVAEITGHHRQAIARHMIGIDYLRLVPLRD